MKQRLYFASLSLIFVLSSAALLVAQEKPKRPSNPPDRRLARAQSITEELIKDATALELSDRALLWMRLGEAWKKVDPERAAIWFKKAVVELEFAPREESSADRHQRIATVRALLSILAPVDKELAARLTAMFTVKSTDGDELDRAENAKALATAAYESVDTDPKLAAALASASLRFGTEGDLSSVALKLRKRDGKLADGLFNELLAAARMANDKELLSSLVWLAFIAPQQPQWSCCAPPDDLSASLLTVLTESFRQASTASDGAGCKFLVSIVAPVLNQYDRLVPAHATIVRQELNKCQTQQLAPEGQLAKGDSGKEQTIDELVAAANDISNPNLRAATLVRVANQAAGQKKFDRAIEILESVGSDIPPFLRGLWGGWRAEWAALSALDHLNAGDRNGVQQIIYAVPANLRAETQILLAEKLDATKERALARELLIDGQKFLARDDVTDRRKADWYPALVRLSAKYIPDVAPAMLSEAIRALNRSERSKVSKEKTPDAPAENASNYLWRPIDLVGPLIDIDENGVRYSVALIESPVLRAQVRLGLLVSSLERLPSRNPSK